MRIRWGIIGAATIAKNKVMPAIEANGGMIQAIASRSQPIDELVKRYHIREIYKDYRQLLASKNVDAVYIALPNSMHYMWVVEAIKHGKHVLIEKPIVLTVSQMEDIKRLAEEQKVVVMEAFMYRYHPQIEAAKRMLQEGEIGDIVAMRSQFHFVLEDWDRDIRITPQLGGGAFYDIGCYCINIQQYMLGEQIIEAKFMSEWHNEVDVKVSGVVRYESGITGQIECSFSGSFTETFEVIGRNGMLRMPHAFRTDVNGHTGVIELYKNAEIERHYYEGDAYQLQMAHFEQVVAGATPRYSLEDMLLQTETLTMLYEKL